MITLITIESSINELNSFTTILCLFITIFFVIKSIDFHIFNQHSIDDISVHSSPLIYYVDGSYSHRRQIAHSGFRTSDGSTMVLRYIPQSPKHGSTESEVYAVSLALEHALNKQKNSLIIFTDNSKVEQLFSRPKTKDYSHYPNFFRLFNQYREQNVNTMIKIERVHGHPTRFEQKQSIIKREFAKIDRLVRKKNRQFIIRQQQQLYISWYHYDPYAYYVFKPSKYLFYF